MARIAGTATFESSPVEGAVIILYDESTNPATEVARTTTNASGEWEFLEVPDATDYHVVSKWDDNGTLYQAKSFPFIQVDATFSPDYVNDLLYWFSAESGVNTTTVGEDELVNFMENLATMAEEERVYAETDAQRPALKDGYIQFNKDLNTVLNHASNPLGVHYGLPNRFVALNGKYTIALAVTEFEAGATAINMGTSSDYDLGSLGSSFTRIKTPATTISTKLTPTLIFTCRADREAGIADFYRENDALVQSVVIDNTITTSDVGRKFAIGARTNSGTTTPGTFRFIEFLFYDRFVTLSELENIHTYMSRHIPV